MNPMTEKERRAWNKIGDVLVPGDDTMPSFSESGVLRWLEDALSPSHPDDQRDLRMLVNVLGWMPSFVIRGIMALTARCRDLPGMAGAPFRMLDMGLRGVIFTLYYSGLDEGNRVFDGIDYHIQCRPLTEEGS